MKISPEYHIPFLMSLRECVQHIFSPFTFGFNLKGSICDNERRDLTSYNGERKKKIPENGNKLHLKASAIYFTFSLALVLSRQLCAQINRNLCVSLSCYISCEGVNLRAVSATMTTELHFSEFTRV